MEDGVNVGGIGIGSREGESVYEDDDVGLRADDKAEIVSEGTVEP